MPRSPVTETFLLWRSTNSTGRDLNLPADGNYFIAETATVIGKVRLLSAASVWFGAVMRGDNEWIEIGEGSNVQDNCTCHTDPGFPLDDRHQQHGRPQRDPARLHARRRHTGRHGLDRHERRAHPPRQRRRRRLDHHRGQGVSRIFPDHRRARARGPDVDAGAVGRDGACRKILPAQRAAISKTD